MPQKINGKCQKKNVATNNYYARRSRNRGENFEKWASLGMFDTDINDQ